MKEKLGGLRYDYFTELEGEEERMAQLVDEAEARGEGICELAVDRELGR